MKSFHLEQLSLLEKIKKNLDELVAKTKPGQSWGDAPRKLVADVSSRAKWLQTAIAKLESQELPEKDED